MAKAALFISPMARKKRVLEKYCPNSYRVISTDAEQIERPQRLSSYAVKDSNMNMLGQSVERQLIDEHRQNRPNPTSVGFLRQDVRLLNEPLCHVRNKYTASEQNQWWPSRANDTSPSKPAHTLDTTVRNDFQYRGNTKSGSGRHTNNPNTRPALGSVPVNFLREPDGKQRFWKEGLSYEHQYNCRTDPQYPIRGKRHGAFVWDRFPETEVDRMIKHYDFKNPNETAASTLSSPVAASQADSVAKAVVSAPTHSSIFWGEDNLLQPTASHTTVLPPIGY